MPVLLNVSNIIRQDLFRRSDWMRPAAIYHYTTTEAFFRIVESQELWLSDYAYLNDASEIHHGLDIASRAVGELIDTECEEFGLFGNVIARAKANPPRLCVACFSLQRDSLSQWRAYSHGGCGVALGFGAAELVTGLGYPDDIHLSRVVYADRQKKRLLRHFVHCFKVARQIDQRSNNPRWLEYYDDFMLAVLFELAALCKDSGFSDEREVRLFFQESKVLREIYGPVLKRFRLASGILVPYVSTNDLHRGREREEKQNRLNLAEVVVGPHPKMALVARSVTEYLESKGYDDVPVRTSTVPFR